MENGGIDWISLIPSENEQKFMDTLLWAKTEFKKKVEELGIPQKYFENKSKYIKRDENTQ